MQRPVLRRREARSTNAIVRRSSSSALAKARRAVIQRNTERDEVGASLLLALIFLTVISVTVASLLGLIGGGLTDSIHFKDARTTESAANSTAELALQYVRYDFLANTVNSSSPVTCTSSMPSFLGLPPMQAYCRTQWYEISGSRQVIVSVCASGDSLTCENRPLLQAEVSFNDNSVSSKNDCTPVSTPVTGTTCGSGLSVVSWVIDATPPTVTNVAVSAAVSGCGGQGLIITGTGFSYVNGFAPIINIVGDPTIYTETASPGTPTEFGDSQIQACIPSGLAAGQSFPVTVTTPSGTSAYNSGSDNVLHT